MSYQAMVDQLFQWKHYPDVHEKEKEVDVDRDGTWHDSCFKGVSRFTKVQRDDGELRDAGTPQLCVSVCVYMCPCACMCKVAYVCVFGMGSCLVPVCCIFVCMCV